jgi:hypothetical protein
MDSTQGLECGMIPDNAINLPQKRPHQFKTLAPLDNENRWAGTNLQRELERTMHTRTMVPKGHQYLY